MTTSPVADQWLSLPSEIEHDTFSTDLLRQFDKKRSKLHFELGLLEVKYIIITLGKGGMGRQKITSKRQGRTGTIFVVRGEGPIKVI
jgi:hypothetical protein